VNADRTDDFLRHDDEGGQRDDRDRNRVELVAVVIHEDALFLAKYPASQRSCLAALPRIGRDLHTVF
jgi:hypothetical protein